MSMIEVAGGDDIARIVLDDGKANAITPEAVGDLSSALTDCATSNAVVIQGRSGFLSAGLDTKAFGTFSNAELAEFLSAWARLLMQLWTHPRPTVVAATGHAVAAGTMLALAADHAVAATGPYRWGLNETRMGFRVPRYVMALAQQRVPFRHRARLLLGGAMITAEEAIPAGFAHAGVAAEVVIDEAMGVAADLAQIPAPAYAETKRYLRQATADEVLGSLDEDVRTVLANRSQPGS